MHEKKNQRQDRRTHIEQQDRNVLIFNVLNRQRSVLKIKTTIELENKT